MNNKAETHLIILIFSVLAIALSIMIFYIWIGVSGITKEQSKIDASSNFITLNQQLTQIMIKNPEIVYKSFRWKIEDECNQKTGYQYIEHCQEKSFNEDTVEKIITDGLKSNYEYVFVKCAKEQEKPIKIRCELHAEKKKDAKNCQKGYYSNFYLPETYYNSGGYEARPPNKIYFTGGVCT